jgi:hypothetical protein
MSAGGNEWEGLGWDPVTTAADEGRATPGAREPPGVAGGAEPPGVAGGAELPGVAAERGPTGAAALGGCATFAPSDAAQAAAMAAMRRTDRGRMTSR